VFDCDGCGACCEHLIIEADQLDAIREPRVAEEGRWLDGGGRLPVEEWKININAREPLPHHTAAHACVFLAADKRCGIYATRPGVCVAMQAGGEQCQSARRFAGLPPLVAIVREASVMDRVREAWRLIDDEDTESTS
jgi:hypothetical protein